MTSHLRGCLVHAPLAINLTATQDADPREASYYDALDATTR